MALHPLQATDAQLKTFAELAANRSLRDAPEFLLIDDQRFSLQLMQAALASQYVLHTAINPHEGFAHYLEQAPDILWLDINMPETNGHQLAKAISTLDPDAYIVMVTASEYIEEWAQAKRNGAKDFITKPYSKQKIRDCVKKYMLAHPARRNIVANAG